MRCGKKSESCSSCELPARFLPRVLLNMGSCSLGTCFLLRFLLRFLLVAVLPAGKVPGRRRGFPAALPAGFLLAFLLESSSSLTVDRYRVFAILDQPSIGRAARLKKPSAEHRNPRELAPARPPLLLCDAGKKENPVGLSFLPGSCRASCRRVLLNMAPCCAGTCFLSRFLSRFLWPAALPAGLPVGAKPPSAYGRHGTTP